jgi:histidyl-tRNA synthetase
MKLQTAKGVRDVPPAEKMVKNQVLQTMQEVFQLYGFSPLETPIIERFSTLSAKGGAGAGSDALLEIFKLSDQGKRKLGLRFDLTLPLARYMAMNPHLKLPFKRYEIGRVFRDGPIKLGRYREFWQVDIDIIGTSSMLADAEIIAVAENVFKKLKLSTEIRINNRKLLNGLLEQAGINDKEQAIIAIDKLAKIGQSGVSKELRQRGYKDPEIKKIFSYIKENVTLSQLKSKVKNPLAKEGLAELQELISYLNQMGVKSVIFDVSLARGLGYYTGTVFEAFLKSGKVTSSIAAGGRYDKLIHTLGGPQIPALGVSFGLEPIMDTLKDIGLTTQAVTKVLVIPIGMIEKALQVVQKLRKENIPTDFAIGKKGVSKNLQYAGALNIPYTIIIGEDEVKKNRLLLRDMQSGTEQLLSTKDVIAKLK